MNNRWIIDRKGNDVGWRDVEYAAVPTDDPRLTAVIDAVQSTHVNGGAFLRIYEARNKDIYDDALRNELRGIDHHLRCFLEAPSVRKGARDLKIPGSIPNLPRYTWYGPYEFEGAVTQLLLCGGAYESSRLEETTARRMSRDFVDALMGSKWDNISVWRMDEAWTKWFHDVAWDTSFVVWGHDTRRWALLCITDTD